MEETGRLAEHQLKHPLAKVPYRFDTFDFLELFDAPDVFVILEES